MYGALGVNVKLAQTLAPVMQQVVAVCDGVHSAGIIGGTGTDSYKQCTTRATTLIGVQKMSPQDAANTIAGEMTGPSAAAMTGKPNYLLWGAVGAVVLVGGAWYFTRKG